MKRAVTATEKAVRRTRRTVWATGFTVWATEKTVAQTVKRLWGTKKRARGGALSYVAQQRYNKNGRNANRPRTAGARQEASFCISMRISVVGSGQWVRPRSSAMSIDVALSTRRDVGRDTYSLSQKRGCAASGTSMGEAA